MIKEEDRKREEEGKREEDEDQEEKTHFFALWCLRRQRSGDREWRGWIEGERREGKEIWRLNRMRSKKYDKEMRIGRRTTSIKNRQLPFLL